VTPVPDHDAVAALIDRLVTAAHIPGRAAREDLRRELWAHFEDAGSSPEASRDALRRFGVESAIAESLQRVYRWDYLYLYLAKIAASIVASMTVALAIQVCVNLRVEIHAEVFRLAPGFAYAAARTVPIVLALVTVWEVVRRPFNRSRALVAIGAYGAVCALTQMLVTNSAIAFANAALFAALAFMCSTVASRPAPRLLLALGSFAAALWLTHFLQGVDLGPLRTLIASSVLVVVCALTARILTRVDHAFINYVEPAG
jgi:hypothetical protein